MSRYCVFIAVMLFASVVVAQTIYEPVQYQYGTQYKVYYGGTNPAVIEALKNDADPAYFARPRCYRSFGFLALPAPVYSDIGAKEVDNPPIIYHNGCGTDPLPLTPDEARTQAYNNVPRFFRMSDLAATARETPEGRVIPAAPPQVCEPRMEIKPFVRPAPATRPASDPAPVLIIPKKALEQPKVGVPVASAK